MGTKDDQNRFIQNIGTNKYNELVSNIELWKQNSIYSFGRVVNSKLNRIEFWFENNHNRYILGSKTNHHLITLDLIQMKFHKYKIKEEIYYDQMENNTNDDELQKRIVFDFII